MAEPTRPRRPASLDDKDAELIWGDSDPALTSEAAHATADAVLRAPTGPADDPTLAGRVGAIIDAEGLDEIAALWSRSPATTLPGAMWRLYLLRAWLQRDPETITMRFREGQIALTEDGSAEGVVAEAPQPAVIDEELTELFTGAAEKAIDVLLDDGANFLRVLAVGAETAPGWGTHDDDAARPVTQRRGALTATAEELAHAAALARADRLD